MTYLINVMAVSLDGKIASKPLETDAERGGIGFSCPEDRRQLLEHIENCDAIVLGANSVRVAGGIIPQRKKNGDYPIWVVFSNHGIPDSHPFWGYSEIPKFIVFSQKTKAFYQTPEHHRWYFPKNPAQASLSRLESEGCSTILLFGGSQINKIFYENNLVDELKITICPIIIGSCDAPSLIAAGLTKLTTLELSSSMHASNHVFLKYKVNKK